MNPDRLIAGLDIGSAKTTAIIAELEGDLPKHPTIKVLGVGQARTTGINLANDLRRRQFVWGGFRFHDW